jgi:Icc-related predicted phosphoesterase
MRILAIADVECKSLWDHFDKSKVADIDLIISCGDLDSKYLSFLATLSSAPVIYVHGNHDKKYKHTPPEGCICIEDEIFVYKGIRILGLGGSMQYAGTEHQYTERQMAKRVQKLKRKLKKHKGFDILVTHSPAFGINDGDDLPHQGFQIFKDLMDEYAPKYFLHGHVHMQYGRKHKREDMYSQTKILNAFERCVFDYEQTSEEM